MRNGDSAGKAIQLIPNHKLILPKKAGIETLKLFEGLRDFLAKEIVIPFITTINNTKKESEKIENCMTS